MRKIILITSMLLLFLTIDAWAVKEYAAEFPSGTPLEVYSPNNSPVSDDVYNATSWDGVTTIAPSKNAVRDKIEALAGGHDAITLDANADTLLSLTTQALGLDTQLANKIFGGPATGAATVPTFRSLVAGDIPDLSGTYLTAEVDPNVDTHAEIIAIIDNTATDVGTGVWTFAGVTLAQDENITQGGETLDHDGTHHVFSDSMQVGGASAGMSTLASGFTVNDDSGGGANDDFIAETNSSATAFVVDASGDDIEVAVPLGTTSSIVFTQQTTTGDGTTTINWGLGNKFQFTFGAQSDTFTFIAPSNPCNLVLKLIQDGGGSRLATWPATVKWPSNNAPILTTTAAAVDIISFYYDGTNYYAQYGLDFS